MLRFGTMGKRVLLIVFSAVFAGISIFGGISVFTLWETERENGRSSLQTTLAQLKAEVEQNYQFLLHLSQHMSPSGPVGMIVSEYIHAEDAYEKGAAKRKLTRALSTYAGLASELVMYIDDALGVPVFYNFTPETGMYDKKANTALYENYQLTYHAIHPSYNRYTMRPVVSLSRTAEFEGGISYEIYIEQATRVPDTLKAQSVPYVFLQLDTRGAVRYSNDVERFPVGSVLSLSEGAFGQYGGYYFVRDTLVFGTQCLLLAPQSAYRQSLTSWLERSLFALFVILLVVLIASTLLYRYVFYGLRIFSKEIDKTIHGDLVSTAQITGINELDALLKHFDAMKVRIQNIMREAAERDQAQRKREYEQLVYQINPHFLLNTLNSLHWLAVINHQDQIGRYISNLSAILSYNLGRAKERPTLRSELAMLKLYLEIEQCRHDFNVSLDIEPGSHLDLRTPRLLFQPIVENAIGHGMDDGGTLSIAVTEGHGAVSIVIEDDGCGIPEETLLDLLGDESASAGVGLRYVRTMLSAMYGDAASLNIESKLGGGTRVTVSLPLSRKEESNDPCDDC